MAILIETSARHRQWFGVAMAAVVFGCAFMWPQPKHPAVAGTEVSIDEPRSFDEVLSNAPPEAARAASAPMLR